MGTNDYMQQEDHEHYSAKLEHTSTRTILTFNAILHLHNFFFLGCMHYIRNRVQGIKIYSL